MSQVESPQQPRQRRRNPLAASLAWLWNRYSPHGEFPLSTAASTVFHILILALIPLLAMNLAEPDKTPPSVVTIRVADAPDAAAGEGDEPTPGDALQAGDPTAAPSEQPPELTAAEKVTEVEQFKPIEKGTTQKDISSTTQQNVDIAKEAARRAQGAVNAAKDRLKENLKNQSGGSGAGAEGRAARPARWILTFEYSSAADAVAQYEGLGATIAFPAQGDKWRYFDRPSSDPKKSQVRDLNTESRLYWVNEDAKVVRMIGDHLGVPPSSLFTAFLPLALEERMLKMELSFNGLDEDEIQSTIFKCVRRGGSYEVIVLSQTAR
jgi:hypothetical protein